VKILYLLDFYRCFKKAVYSSNIYLKSKAKKRL